MENECPICKDESKKVNNVCTQCTFECCTPCFISIINQGEFKCPQCNKIIDGTKDRVDTHTLEPIIDNNDVGHTPLMEYTVRIIFCILICILIAILLYKSINNIYHRYEHPKDIYYDIDNIPELAIVIRPIICIFNYIYPIQDIINITFEQEYYYPSSIVDFSKLETIRIFYNESDFNNTSCPFRPIYIDNYNVYQRFLYLYEAIANIILAFVFFIGSIVSLFKGILSCIDFFWFSI